MSTCVVTSNTRHLPAAPVSAHARCGSVDIAAIAGRATLAFKNTRLYTRTLLLANTYFRRLLVQAMSRLCLAYLLTHSSVQRNTVELSWCGHPVAPVPASVGATQGRRLA